MRVFRKKSTAVVAKQTPREKLKYVKKNWQLYVFFLLPGLLLTLIFKYGPMGGILIAFEDYNVYAEVKCIRAAVGLSDPDHPCASAQPDPQDGDPKEDSASDLCTELYLGHRTLWYGPYVPFSRRTDQFTVRD